MSVLDARRGELREFCERRPIRRLMLFGSVLRGEEGPQSDVDLLVEFDPGAHVDLFDMAEMQFELTDMLGRTVDLRTPAELSKYFRDEVIQTAETVYAS